MPQADTNIDTVSFGLALKFRSPGKHNGPTDTWAVEFDTGIVMFVPHRMMDGMTFHLQERD